MLQLTSANAGYVAVNAQSYADQPDGGATDALVALDWWAACATQRGQLAPLVDSAAGDVAMLTQLSSQPVADAGAMELRSIVRAATLPAFTVADYTTTRVAAALSPAAALAHLSLDYRQSVFDLHRPAVHASAVPSTSTVTVTALPYTADEGPYTAAPDVAVLRALQPATDVALEFDTQDPFPPTGRGW